MVRTGEELATIEAIFETGGEELLIRREITAQGRSRAFVNGALATGRSSCVICHPASSNFTASTNTRPCSIRQRILTWSTRSARWQQRSPRLFLGHLNYGSRRAARSCHAQAKGRRRPADAVQEIVTAFQLAAELDRAALKADGSPLEDVDLASTKQVLASAERVQRLCAESYAALYESDGAVLAALGGVWRRVSDLAALDRRFEPFLAERDGIKSQLEELAAFLRQYSDAIEASPERLQEVDDRLALLERLKRKYGPTLRECVERREALREELSELERGDERIAELEREQAQARERYVAAAQALSVARHRVAATLAGEIEKMAGDLAMDQTRFEVRFAAELGDTEWSARGIDRAEFYLSPNPGEDLRPLARTVSGGELSRLMLAIKTLTATSRLDWNDADGRPPSGSAPGLIFDEVDAGIGGRVAEVVGRKLYALGSAFQVPCITHLPQIAAYADAHYAIEKRIDAGRTRTTVACLEGEARVTEIGRMLGGDMVTDGLRASAEEMLRLRVEQRPSAAQAKGERKSKGESERAKAKGRRGA